MPNLRKAPNVGCYVRRPRKSMLRMKFKLLILTIIFLQISCGQKYKMTDMQGQQIDVTDLVIGGKFKTHYCDGTLDKLIEINPGTLDSADEDVLQKQFIFWRENYNRILQTKLKDTLMLTVDSLYAKTKYQYSYIINLNQGPVQVYRTDINENNKQQLRLFIRANVDKIFFDNDYRSTGWILNSCDSLNSIIAETP